MLLLLLLFLLFDKTNVDLRRSPCAHEVVCIICCYAMEHDRCNQDTRVMMLFFSFSFFSFFASFFLFFFLNSFPPSRVMTFFTVAEVAMPHAFCR